MDLSLDEPVAGRWRLLAPMGGGASGEVYEGEDLVTGAPVALKFLSKRASAFHARVRREITALRILQLPGVVSLLDDGRIDSRHYIVMQYVDGRPFPGTMCPAPWSVVEPLVVSLLQTLVGVHAAGIIHRDLKPGNVLVSGEGGVHVLDFGLARGPALGETLSVSRAVAGSPRYMAPEQGRGASDARSDLYAVGAMLFEALSGEYPYPETSFPALLDAKLGRDAPSIAAYVDDLPVAAQQLVDGLLRRDPADRPQSAGEALSMLAGTRQRVRLPRLGSVHPVNALVEAARARRSVSLGGGPGSGRTRALADAAAILRSEGIAVVDAVPAHEPLGSLAPLLQPLPPHAVRAEAVEEAVREALAGGTVVVVDRPDTCDRWSRALLGSCLDDGAILGMGTAGVTLPELDEEDLRALFHGPERLLHLPTDAARELYRRAGGSPSRVAAEVDAWLAAGLVAFRGERLVIARATIERLASGLHIEPALPGGASTRVPTSDVPGLVAMAWPYATEAVLTRVTGLRSWELRAEISELERSGQLRRRADGSWEPVAGVAVTTAGWSAERRAQVHTALAAVLPPGAEGRLAHLAFAGDRLGAGAEALLVGNRLAETGQLNRAAAIYELGLMVVREGAEVPGEPELLVALAEAAITLGTREALHSAIAQLGRAHASTAPVHEAAALLRALSSTDDGPRAARLRGLGTLQSPGLERCRLGALLRFLALEDAPAAEALLDDLAGWAAGVDEREGYRALWLGSLRYRHERYDEAAEVLARAAGLLPGIVPQLAALLAGASALLDAGQLAAARVVAQEARARAEAARLPQHEARAEWVLRSVRYRAGEPMAPDLELVEACRADNTPWILGQVLLGEAAVAWRGGDGVLAERLAFDADRAWERAGFPAAATLARSLAVASTRSRVPEALLHAAEHLAIPGFAMQALALLASVDESAAHRARPRVQALVEAVPGARRGARMEVISPNEALDAVRPAAGRAVTVA